MYEAVLSREMMSLLREQIIKSLTGSTVGGTLKAADGNYGT